MGGWVPCISPIFVEQVFTRPILTTLRPALELLGRGALEAWVPKASGALRVLFRFQGFRARLRPLEW